MFKVAIGQGEDIDTRKAVTKALSRCVFQLQSLRPQAGIVYSSIDFDHDLVLSEIRRRFPGIELVGGTTGGEFSSDFGFSDDSVNLVLFHSDTIQIKAGVGRQVSTDPMAAAAAAVEQAGRSFAERASLCMVFPDGITGSPSAVVRSLNHLLPPQCPVFGGVPSRYYEVPAPILQFFGDEVLEDAVPLLLFSGPLRYAFSISNSWKPIGVQALVTESSGYEVRRIGHKRAIDFYRYYLGKHRYPALEFPLAVYESDLRHFFIRSPSDYDERRGSVFFSGPIPKGTTVQLTEVTRNRIISDTKASLGAVAETFRGKWLPTVALAFSCATRKEILGTRTPEELRILKDSLPEGLPICGFYTFGELSPLRPNDGSRLHNCTLVTVLIGEGKTREPVVAAPAVSKALMPDRSPTVETIEVLKRENRFLQKKLTRSEHYRARLERNKDLNDTLLRKINRDMKRAHLEIKRKSDLLRQSLALANEIQLNLLPRQDPSNEDLDIAGQSVYCSATGGDYYDFISFPKGSENRVDVVVGDVTGHGIEAALLMTTARALLRCRAFQPGSLAEVITDVNRHLTTDLYESGRFVSLFYLTIEPVSDRLSWVRAGHDPAFLYDPASDRFEELRGKGIALGVDRRWPYEVNQRRRLAAGQLIFLGTDGIWETFNTHGRMFGKQPILDIIRKNALASAREIVDRIIGGLDHFRDHQDPEDDITLVVIKIKR